MGVKRLTVPRIACEQALQGNLVAGREKEGELATTSLQFEYLRRKSRCEMLIGRDDISNARLCSKENFREPFGLPIILAKAPRPQTWSPE